MMKNVIVMICLVSFYLTGCVGPEDLMTEGIKEVEFERISGDTIYLRLGLGVTNHGSGRIRVREMDLNLFLGTIPVGSLKDCREINIEPGHQLIWLLVQLDTGILRKRYLELLQVVLKEGTQMTIKGNVRAGMLFFQQVIQVNEKVEFDLLRSIRN
jgi:LEA14-like dessication related protein